MSDDGEGRGGGSRSSGSDDDGEDGGGASSGGAPPTAADVLVGPSGDDTLRIMLSTDNHLGYNEREYVPSSGRVVVFCSLMYIQSNHFRCPSSTPASSSCTFESSPVRGEFELS